MTNGMRLAVGADRYSKPFYQRMAESGEVRVRGEMSRPGGSAPGRLADGPEWWGLGC